MASDRRPGNLAHLERLLSAWSREDDQAPATARRLRRLVAISVLATMLDGLTENGDTHLAFKGGASMEFRFGATARASCDVDVLADLDFDEAFVEIGRRLRAGWEGFTGTLTERTEIIRAGIVPAPQRCKIKVSYRDRPFATLAFDLGRAEANSFELLEEVANATNMDKVQLGPKMTPEQRHSRFEASIVTDLDQAPAELVARTRARVARLIEAAEGSPPT
jgi:Nucleotidyl transferase AbiEii toxin, Type IV TA system